MFCYTFWIQSSRGTDSTTVRAYREKPSKEKLDSDLEEWCEKFGAWHVSENAVSYGWKQIKVPTKAECIKRHSRACEQARKWKKEEIKYHGLLCSAYN
jgi:hypothetical protein